MYGAIAGDVYCGIMQSRDQDAESEKQPVKYSAASILTAAVGDALLKVGPSAKQTLIRDTVAQSLRSWAHTHPEVQYSNAFLEWLDEENPTPSDASDPSVIAWISAAGWLFSSLEHTEDAAGAAAKAITANEDIIEAVQCIADLIYLARTNRTKHEMLSFAELRFGYNIAPYIAALRANENLLLSAQTAGPIAVAIFMESATLPEVVRLALHVCDTSGNGNTTIAAASASILEAWNAIGEAASSVVRKNMPEDCLRVMDEISQYEGEGAPLPEDKEKVERLLSQFVGTGSELKQGIRDAQEELSLENEAIEKAVGMLNAEARPGTTEPEDSSLEALKNALLYSLRNDGQILVAWNVIFADNAKLDQDAKTFFTNGMVRFYEAVRADVYATARSTAVMLGEKPAMALFTNTDELRGAQSAELPLRRALITALEDPNIDGVVINPFGNSATLNKDVIRELLEKSSADNADLALENVLLEDSPLDAAPDANNQWNPQKFRRNADIESAAAMSRSMAGRFQVLSATMADNRSLESVLTKSALEERTLLIPYKAVPDYTEELEEAAIMSLKQGSKDTTQLWARLMPVAVTGTSGTPYSVAFTRPDEAEQWQNTYRLLELTVEETLHLIENMEENVGLAINPFSSNAHIDRRTAMSILRDVERAKEKA